MEEKSSLPLVLAGPILRRVTDQSVTVWLASSQSLSLTLRVYDSNGEQVGCSIPPDSPDPRIMEPPDSRQHKVSLGDNLHITLLEARPDRGGGNPFPSGKLLTYSLFNNDGQELPEIADVCLAGESRPGFYIANALRMLAYGSCRKPHGHSFDDQENIQQKDSLALLAEHLAENVHTLDNRPSHLFLVGDQIYADEIVEPVMDYLQKLAIQLIGKDIALPCGTKPGEISSVERTQLKKDCGLTSDCADMHLIGFGEFAAMYLLILGNRINFTVPDNAPDTPAIQSLRHFLASQPQVRKTFANIPTYMMFDDHDVTDDWNLNRSWYNQVHRSVSGDRVVSNALAALWAFQAWGNEPAHFPQNFIDTIQEHLIVPERADAAKHYDFTLRKFRHWGFILPTTPPIFVLDCRTQRDFGTFNSPPELLDRYARDALREAWFKLKAQRNQDKTVPIFITGTPVFGFSVIEWVQQFAYRMGFLFGVSAGMLSPSRLDIESWIANGQGFSSFLNTIRRSLGYKKATFIAGDVHYSFANHAIYTCQTEPEPLHLECLQLTSSALRNTPETGRALETFLANGITKVRRGHSKLESLQWWYRIFFWRFLKKYTWKIEVTGIPGKAQHPRPKPTFKAWWEPMVAALLNTLWQWLEKRDGKPRTDPNTYWITCRPNVGLVYLQNGEVTKQVLLSGDRRDNTLTYEIGKQA